MKDNKDVLLCLDCFDENNMSDFEHNNNLYYVSEVLRFKMYHRTNKYDLNFNVKKPGILQEIKKLFDGVLQYEEDSVTECESLE